MAVLPREPAKDDLEDYVAAMFQAAGYYVEKNVKETDPQAILELDIIATDYRQSPSRTYLIEAKSGEWGYTGLFKIAGQMRYLGISEAAMFVSREMQARPLEVVQRKVRKLGLNVVLIDFRNPSRCFSEAGFQPITSEYEIGFWRWSHRMERRVTQLVAAGPKTFDDVEESPLAIRKYHSLVNDGIFFVNDVKERLVALYDAYQAHPRLSLGTSREIDGQGFDPSSPGSGGETFKAALFEGHHPLIQNALYVEHRARLAILKCAIDLVEQEPGLPAELQRRTKDGLRYLVLPELPASFRQGIEWLCERPSYRRYALLWQLLLWGLGGFFLTDKEHIEFEWLSERSGVPLTEIPDALMAYDKFFPMGGVPWLAQASNAHFRLVKLVPVAFRGLGSNLRRHSYGWENYSEAPYADFTALDLEKWNNVGVDLVA